MARRQLVTPFPDALRIGDVPERQEVDQCGEVDPPPEPWPAEKRLELGSEDEIVAAGGEVERLLSRPIAGAEEPSVPRVPDGEGEHARKVTWTLIAPVAERLDQDLGVRARPELRAAVGKLGPQLPKVVDLTVEGDDESAIRG